MIPERKSEGLVLTLLLFVASAIASSLGLVFLCAAVENSRRLYVSLPLLAGGAALAIWAGRRWWAARQRSQPVLAQRLLDLAASRGGEVTELEIMSELDISQQLSQTVLAHLEAEGLAYGDRRGTVPIFVFPGLTESKVTRRCASCGNEYSVRQPLHKCPTCGGHLELVRT